MCSRRNREERIERARKWAEGRARSKPTQAKPGTASKHIRHVAILAKAIPGLRVVIYARVSSREQRPNLKRQTVLLRDRLRGLGCVVLRRFVEGRKKNGRIVGDSTGYAWQKGKPRPILEAAIDYAKKHNAVLVAESTDRLIRNEHFRTDNRIAATEKELRLLVERALGVKLATWHHPDLALDEITRLQTKDGQRMKGKMGGRPATLVGYKRARREALRPEARQMRRQGISIRQIATALGKKKSTVQDWVKGVRIPLARKPG